MFRVLEHTARVRPLGLGHVHTRIHDKTFQETLRRTCQSQTLVFSFAGEIACQDVWQRERAQRGHCVAMWGWENTHGGHYCVHGEEALPGPVHVQCGGGAVDQPVQNVVHTDVCTEGFCVCALLMWYHFFEHFGALFLRLVEIVWSRPTYVLVIAAPVLITSFTLVAKERPGFVGLTACAPRFCCRDANIARFTSNDKPMPPDVCVLVSTYNMLGFQGHRSNVAAKVCFSFWFSTVLCFSFGESVVIYMSRRHGRPYGAIGASASSLARITTVVRRKQRGLEERTALFCAWTKDGGVCKID